MCRYWKLYVLLVTLLGVSSVHGATPNPVLNNMADDTWLNLNAPLASGSSSTPASGTLAYSGMAYDSTNHKILLFGGGHNDGYDDRVWVFDFNTLNWSPDYASSGDPFDLPLGSFDEANYPGAIFDPVGESIADAHPVSLHTYDNLTFITQSPNGTDINSMFLIGASAWRGPTNDPPYWPKHPSYTWTYDHVTKKWTWRDADLVRVTSNNPSGKGSASEYDHSSGLVYVFGPEKAGVWTYNADTDQYSKVSDVVDQPNLGIEISVVYVNRQGEEPAIYEFGGEYATSGNTLYRYEMATKTWTAMPASGDIPPENGGYGLVYDTHNDVLLAYRAGGSIYAYRFDTNQWERKAAGPTEVDRVHGNIQYDPVNNVSILAHKSGSSVETWAYRYKVAGPRDTLSPAEAEGLSVSFLLEWLIEDSEPKNSKSTSTESIWSIVMEPFNSLLEDEVSSSGGGVLASAATWGGGGIQWLTLLLMSLYVAIRRRFILCKVIIKELVEITFMKIAKVVALIIGLALCANAAAAPVVTFTAESLSANSQSNVPVTFGQVFAEGDVAAGTQLIAELADGTKLSTQVDKKATHSDGSLRHAVVTAVIPALSPGEQKAINLVAGSDTSSGEVSLNDLYGSGFDAQVSLTESGTVFTANAIQMIQAGGAIQWLSGELVSEWIAGGAFKDSNGVPHPHLAAYFHVRMYSDGRVRVDVVVENGWTFASSPNMFTYNVAVNIQDSGIVYQRSALEHFSHARWHKQFWWNGMPDVYAKLDVDYIQESRAVPNYANLTPSEAKLNSMISSVEPMERGDLRRGWSDGGASEQIAPLPEWTALYLVSGDYRAYQSMLANSDGLGAYSLHYRDENTGGLPSIENYPTISITLDQLIPNDSGTSTFTHDRAHQPSTSYVPYLVSGDYFHLEELLYLANYNLIFASPAKRNGAAGEFLRDNDYELRGKAWGLRTVAHAGYIAPDSHPLKGYFTDKVVNNIRYVESEYVDNPSWVGRALGLMPDYDYPSWLKVSYWMQAFFAWTMGHLVELGYPAERAHAWKSTWTAGLMGPDHCYQFATTNRADIALATSPSTPFTTFSELWANHPATNIACGSAEMATWLNANPPQYSKPSGGFVAGEIPYTVYTNSYYSNLQPALAVAIDGGVASQGMWDTFAVDTARVPDYSDEPQWAIVPRAFQVADDTTPSAPASLMAN